MKYREFIPENLKDNELKINEQINERISKLTFADDFIFYSVLAGDSDICKAVIESCIGKPIDRIVYTNGQEAMKLIAEGKGIWETVQKLIPAICTHPLHAFFRPDSVDVGPLRLLHPV